MYAKKGVSMKVVVLLLAVVLVIGCVAGGTVAYLMAKSSEVTNAFVAGNIGNLTLDETTGTSYMVTPGVDIDKNPTVTFEGNNVAAYVFLKVDAAGWAVTGSDTTYTYSIGDNQEMTWVLEGWTKLQDGIYYKEVAANTSKQIWSIIQNDRITVSSTITKDNISNYTKSLTFTAYAIQKDSFATVSDAWTQAQTATN